MSVVVGVSLKMYFSHAQATAWFADVAERVREHAAVASGSVEFFVVPTYLQIGAATDAFAGTPVRVGAQDVAAAASGAYTGEVSAGEIAEVGASLAEIGHAERRAQFGDTDEVVAAKTAAALGAGLTPVLCVGETEHMDPAEAAAATIAQLRDALGGLSGRVIVAYEPVWAIGAPEPAPAAHIRAVCRALREEVSARGSGDAVIYGGSAGPGLLETLGGDADGLFLGRFAHDPDRLVAVLDEAATLAEARA
ncbi:triose-phosphate isomerase family protein [Microbacterium excoecariae]|uniref:triose-phosphate isomerase family protein n=1 Tax=Microbacterium excoecariae TaxID=2715210 RepID=UPI001407B6B5|nr:triose-phosphate isomerase family protein [Microbacterium excoecariae]NHI15730.1 triosephosphate isomerase [Microbacterium excoecariae]